MAEEKKDYLFNLLDDLNILYNTLKNNKRIIKQSYEGLIKEVAIYKTRIDYDPDVKILLDILQQHEHEKSVGAYERLLSALLQDVLPGNREVIMSLSTERSVSSLNISTRKNNNPPEDPYSGNGGSVSNILSVGLRLIALIRSGKRRFLVLDESDCWIKPLFVPKFANVIKEMSHKMGLQVLMISHHDDMYFEDIPHKLELVKTEMGLEASWAKNSEIPVWDEEDEGFRSVMLSNFQSHTNTFLPLSPGVTLFIGDNDIGKSSVVSALRAVFYGESDDSLIKHYEPSTKISIDLGNGKALFWERKAGKGSPKDPKEVYTLIDVNNGNGIDNPLHRTEGAKKLPDWIEEEIGIGLIEGLDVQIGHQKKPVFLLDQPGSVKAKALAIGSDSSYVQKMLKISKEEMTEAKATIRNAEKTLEQYQRNLISLKTIEEHDDFFISDAVNSYKKKINYLSDFLDKYVVVLNKWEECIFLKDSFKVLTNTPETENIPDLIDLSSFNKLLSNWKEYSYKIDCFSLLENVEPTLEIDYDFELSNSLKELKKDWGNFKNETQKYQKLQETVKTPDVVIDIESDKLKVILEKWKKQNVFVSQYQDLNNIEKTNEIVFEKNESYKKLKYDWIKAEDHKNKIFSECEEIKKEEEKINKILMSEFPICPTCLRPWTKEHKD